MATSFFLSRRSIRPAAQSGMPLWQDKLFIGLAKMRERRDRLLPDPDRPRRRGRHPGHGLEPVAPGSALDASFGPSMTDITLLRPSLDGCPNMRRRSPGAGRPIRIRTSAASSSGSLRRDPAPFSARPLQSADWSGCRTDGRCRACRPTISGSATANSAAGSAFASSPERKTCPAPCYGPYRLHDRALEAGARLRHRRPCA